MSNINAFVVKSENGSVDVEASCLKFRGELEKHLAAREVETSAIAEAVHAVFDQYKGVNINMPALTNAVLSRMGATPSTFAVLSERTAEYVRENAGEGGAFKIAKGKGGGVRRVADIAPAAK